MSERCPGRSNEYRRDASGGSSLSFVGAGILYTSTEFVDNATLRKTLRPIQSLPNNVSNKKHFLKIKYVRERTRGTTSEFGMHQTPGHFEWSVNRS